MVCLLRSTYRAASSISLAHAPSSGDPVCQRAETGSNGIPKPCSPPFVCNQHDENALRTAFYPTMNKKVSALLRSLVRTEQERYPAWPSIEEGLEAKRELARCGEYYEHELLPLTSGAVQKKVRRTIDVLCV